MPGRLQEVPQVSSFELGITRVVPQRAAGQSGDAATHAVDWRFDIRLWHWHGYGVVGGPQPWARRCCC
jgi:hypothetical protein